jgi:hypothetical protein
MTAGTAAKLRAEGPFGTEVEMPIDNEFDDARREAQLALLRAIRDRTEQGNPSPTTLLVLAEAAAWCVAPAQSHGGRSSS